MDALDRGELVSRVLGQVATLGAALEGAATGEDTGDDSALNEGAAFPAVWVGYRRGVFRGNQETGARSSAAALTVDVVVQTEDPGPDARTGHAQALRLLNALDGGLEGFAVWPGHRLALQAEERTLGMAGLWEFVQRYEVRPFISRP